MLFEIRNYHFDPEHFEEYKAWAKTEAIPYLCHELDVLGFWVNTRDAPVIQGEPHDSLGTANVTWIIRWRDLAHRSDVLPALWSTPEWKDIYSRVPGGRASYLRIEAKFSQSLA